MLFEIDIDVRMYHEKDNGG